MPTDVVMPQMGESITEGTLTKWLKKVGDTVQRDEPLFEISTDKVDAEIPSPTAGVLQEIKTPELDAQLVAENVALQIERRISFRRAMKKSMQQTMDFGAQGIKLRCAGRLGGAEISRAEWYREGKIPLHTLRQPIDYGFAEANTVYGKIGVKCWLCKPEGAAEPQPVEKREAPPAEPTPSE